MESTSDVIIKVADVSKTFKGKDNNVEALRNINLDIMRGDIFGIIGMSGAGKSTLVRCLNFLERPTTGTVYVDGHDLNAMSPAQLRAERLSIAMIFQHFNLLMQRNVIGNVMFPMEIAGVDRKKAKKRAMELLTEVGLADKAKSYPAQLSGGQQQRVAIARALANNPKILLCDEATSALDPTTTKSILALLKEINEKHGITIVIITHSMSVVEEICNKVAIIDGGELAETGNVVDVFSNPQSAAAKKLVFPEGQSSQVASMSSKKYVRIVFSQNSSFEPVVANMVLEFKTPVNILLADTRDIGGIAKGQMILQLPDDEQLADSMLAFLKDRQLEVEVLENYVG